MTDPHRPRFLRFIVPLSLVSIALLVCLSQGAMSEGHDARREPTASWCLYSPLCYEHDGVPLETENFVVFSDTASDWKKEFVAGQAESAWTEILALLDIESEEDLAFAPGRTKVDIFLLEEETPEWGGWAYYGGFLLSPIACSNVYCSIRTIKHELMHVLGFLLAGPRSIHGMLVDVWFDEGLAEYVAGTHEITTQGEYEARCRELDLVISGANPVSVHKWDDLATSATGTLGIHAYELFELAVRYLLDEDGLGRTMDDVRQLYLDLREGYSFVTAFERQFGLPLLQYEVGFQSYMDTYLP